MNTPRSLGRYNILETIGQGMQGRIFRARDEIFGEVALKAARISESATAEEVEEIRRRLEVEARRQRELSASCASILPAYDVLVAEDGQIYVVQAYAEGGSLRNVIGPVGDEQMLADWGGQLCDALQTAHDASIYHCDVKPENILRDAAGNPKLTDFGVAVETSRLKDNSPLVGTPAYMAPELWETHRPGPATDLFALGVVLYELATGKHPYNLESPDTEHVRKRICETSGLPMRARVAWPKISPELAAILDNAVARDPIERYRTCKPMRRDLAEHREQLESRETRLVHGEPVQLPLRVRLRRAARRIKRRSRPVLLVAAVLAIAGIVWTFFPRTLVPEPWVEERIAYFNDALVERNAERLLREIWRNAPGNHGHEALATAKRTFDEFRYYDAVELRIPEGGFDGASQEVTVELVARVGDLPREVVLMHGPIAFEQNDRGQLLWRDPAQWLINLDDSEAHRDAVTRLFMVQLWQPLQGALAGLDEAGLAALYDAPPATEDLREWLHWLGAYDRPRLDDWLETRDPRESNSIQWKFAFDASGETSHSIRLAYTRNDQGRWKLSGPRRFPEPEDHVHWAVTQRLNAYRELLRTGQASVDTLIQSLGFGQTPDATTRENLSASLAWMGETNRSSLDVTHEKPDVWETGGPSATVEARIRYEPATHSTAPSTQAQPETLAVQLSFRRDEAGRWSPARPSEFVLPEPATLGAVRLLAGTDAGVEDAIPGPALAAEITQIHQALWPERVHYLTTTTSVDPANVPRPNETSGEVEVRVFGRYRAEDDDRETRTNTLTITTMLERGPVFWQRTSRLDPGKLLFKPPSEDVQRVADRFDASVMPTLQAVFEEKSFNAVDFELLLAPETADIQRDALRRMFTWLARHKDDVEFWLTREQPIVGEPNTATVRLDAAYTAGDELIDLGNEWWADLQFDEKLSRPTTGAAATKPAGRWTLRIPPDAETGDYAWLPPPTLVRFDPVADALATRDWASLYERYLPSELLSALADDLARMDAWMKLETTRVEVTHVGTANLDDTEDVIVTVPMTLTATFGERKTQHTMELRFAEIGDRTGQWTLTAPDARDTGSYRQHYVWYEPPEHAVWCVTQRLQRAARAYADGDQARYAEAITGSAEQADDFFDFLADYGPARYRFTVESVAVPTRLDNGIQVRITLNAMPLEPKVDPLHGVFVWRSNTWLAASPADWLISSLTAARVKRMLRSGNWIEARSLFLELPPDQKAIAQTAVDSITFHDRWRNSSVPELDPNTGLPIWFDDEYNEYKVRFRLIMTEWPDDGGKYALYVQEQETSTTLWEQEWPKVEAELRSQGANDGDLSTLWKDRMKGEVENRLNNAISEITWRQALTFAHLLDRDLPTEAEWLVAAGTLDVKQTRLVGGVWEWCLDEAGNGHVIRGGCWIHAATGATPTISLRETQGSLPDETIGFRTVIRIPTRPIR